MRALKLTVKPPIKKALTKNPMQAPHLDKKTDVPQITIFRSVPKELSQSQVKAMLKKFDFFDKYNNKTGKGFPNQFELKIIKNKRVVVDHAAGLMWQKGGSNGSLIYDKAKDYIEELKHI